MSPASGSGNQAQLLLAAVFSNNVVGVIDQGKEVVLIGRGIGFGKRRGDAIDPARIERRYHLADDDASRGVRSLLVDLPYEVVTLTAKIADYLAQQHGIKLSPAVEIGLADHLSAAITRLEQGVPLYNNLLWETKAAYRSEFKIALGVLEVVRTEAGIDLPLDEAGFITMHLVNAGVMGDMAETVILVRALHDILAIVREDMPGKVTPDSPYYVRFLTHLKFVLQRLTEQTQLSGHHPELLKAQLQADPVAYECSQRITSYLATTTKVELSEEEQLYLMIHLSRLKAG
jgi:beta-glucoside operon transcriptional antiterminator